jgi:hypothetical protein
MNLANVPTYFGSRDCLTISISSLRSVLLSIRLLPLAFQHSGRGFGRPFDQTTDMADDLHGWMPLKQPLGVRQNRDLLAAAAARPLKFPMPQLGDKAANQLYSGHLTRPCPLCSVWFRLCASFRSSFWFRDWTALYTHSKSSWYKF